MDRERVIPRLKAAGWRVYPSEPVDFIPWEDDDLIPVSEVASNALKCALKGDVIPWRPFTLVDCSKR